MDMVLYALLKNKMSEMISETNNKIDNLESEVEQKLAILDAGLTSIASVNDGSTNNSITSDAWNALNNGDVDVFAVVNGILVKANYTTDNGNVVIKNSNDDVIATISIDGSEYSIAWDSNVTDADISLTQKGLVDTIGFWREGGGQNSIMSKNATEANGNCAIAEGYKNKANGDYAHSEGEFTYASGRSSHSEGTTTTASGRSSHSEGFNTFAPGYYAHTQGNGTQAYNQSQTALGEYNIKDPSNKPINNRGTYVEIVGNGTDSNNRSNARTLDWNGNEWLAGSLTLGQTSINEQELDKIKTLGENVTIDDSKTYDLDDYVKNTDWAGTTVGGVVKINSTYGVGINDGGILALRNASVDQIKTGDNTSKSLSPRTVDATAFYGLAKASGDTTQSQSDNAVGVYTDSAKSAIQSMLGVTNALSNKVDKDAVDNAGITGRTYTALFGGQFTVTTATTNGYNNPYKRATVTGRISKHYIYKVTVNDVEYILPCRLWYENEKTYEYLGNLGLYITSTSDVPGGTDNVDFVIISDLNNSSSIDVLTRTVGTYTIKVERINETLKKLPRELIYQDAYEPFHVHNNGGTFNGFSVGVNSLKNTRGTAAIGYSNSLEAEFTTAIGFSNVVSGNASQAFGTRNTVSGSFSHADGASNTVSGNYAHAEGFYNKATGSYSHVENYANEASGDWSHAEGEGSKAIGSMSHAEGQSTASGYYSHSEGIMTESNGTASHADGFGTVANCMAQHVFGSFNTLDTVIESETSSIGSYIEMVGNGDSPDDRSNARTLDWDGNERLSGQVYVGCNADSTGGTKLVSETDYATNAKGGTVRINPDYGVNINANGHLYVGKATSAQMKSGSGDYRPIVSSNEHEAVFYGLAKSAGDTTQASSDNTVGTYTDEAKSAIRTMIGAVDENARAGENTWGLVRSNTAFGIIANTQGIMQISAANAERIKEGTNVYKPIVPSTQHQSVFYGLAKAAGDTTQSQSSNAVGTYTDSAKSAIKAMLGTEESIAMVEPTITASKAYAVGDLVVVNSKLYKVTAAIAQNDVFTEGTNVSETKVADEIGNDRTRLNGLEGLWEAGTGENAVKMKGATSASGANSLAEGLQTQASARYAHAEGINTRADNWGAHVEGNGSVASGYLAHAEGMATYAQRRAQHAFGSFNVIDTEGANKDVKGNFIEIVGNGEDNARSNARTLDWSGNERLAGQVYVGCNTDSTGGTKLVSETDYATSTTGGVVIVDENNGIGIESQHKLYLNYAESNLIKAGTGNYRPISPPRQHESVFYGLAKAAGDSTQSASDNAVGTYTDDAKTAIRTMLGAVGETDYASSSKGGVVKVNTSFGININSSGELFIYSPTLNQCKNGAYNYIAVTPSVQHASAFYGLSKAAGVDMASSSNAIGTYTPEAKAAIKNMIGVSDVEESIVSGTDPVIVANSNTRYVCGEVTSIDFTPSSSGICDVVFTSGSTVAILTLPSTVKMPEWWDGTLETDTIYEINILNGTYGTVMSWKV